MYVEVKITLKSFEIRNFFLEKFGKPHTIFCTNPIICLGINRHLVSGHEISRLQHGLQLIVARYTRIINCRP